VRANVYFRIGEGLDGLVRQAYWYENRKEWAIKVLDCLKGITEEQKMAVLQGDAQLKPSEDGRKVLLTREPDEGFKAELKAFLDWRTENYTEIAGRFVSNSTLKQYVDFVIKRYRMAMVRPKLLASRPTTVLFLEHLRRSYHDQVLREAGFKEKEGLEYAEFETALMQQIDKQAKISKVDKEELETFFEDLHYRALSWERGDRNDESSGGGA